MSDKYDRTIQLQAHQLMYTERQIRATESPHVYHSIFPHRCTIPPVKIYPEG